MVTRVRFDTFLRYAWRQRVATTEFHSLDRPSVPCNGRLFLESPVCSHALASELEEFFSRWAAAPRHPGRAAAAGVTKPAPGCVGPRTVAGRRTRRDERQGRPAGVAPRHACCAAGHLRERLRSSKRAGVPVLSARSRWSLAP